uniref:C2H2-type domain-containing protein n=1 Tax=Acrobeloides nanus TaxID=290746 RepID=A0A914CYQ3_9BILA
MSFWLGKSEHHFKDNYKIASIDSYSDFIFKDKEIHAFKHYGIGPGKLMRANIRGNGPLPYFMIEARGGINSPSHKDFWLSSSHEEERPNVVLPQQDTFTGGNDQVEEDLDENEEDGVTQNRIFQCTVDGCGKSFVKYGNYRRHMDIGKHDNFVKSKVHVTERGYVELSQDLEKDIEDNEGDEDVYFLDDPILADDFDQLHQTVRNSLKDRIENK